MFNSNRRWVAGGPAIAKRVTVRPGQRPGARVEEAPAEVVLAGGSREAVTAAAPARRLPPTCPAPPCPGPPHRVRHELEAAAGVHGGLGRRQLGLEVLRQPGSVFVPSAPASPCSLRSVLQPIPAAAFTPHTHGVAIGGLRQPEAEEEEERRRLRHFSRW